MTHRDAASTWRRSAGTSGRCWTKELLERLLGASSRHVQPEVAEILFYFSG